MPLAVYNVHLPVSNNIIPLPVYNIPLHAFNNPLPVYNMRLPVYNMPTPVYNKLLPVFKMPLPVYDHIPLYLFTSVSVVLESLEEVGTLLANLHLVPSSRCFPVSDVI